MFLITQSVIEKTESYLLNIPTKNRVWSLFSRYYIFPIKYLLLGVNETLKPLTLWALTSFVLLMLGVIVSRKFNMPSEYIALIYSICIYPTLIFVLFAVPSTYAYYGVQSSYIDEIVTYLEDAELDSIEKLELLEENIAKIGTRIMARVTFYKWLIGAIWTIVIILINIQTKLMLKLQTSGWEKIFEEGLIFYSICFVVTLFILLLIHGYKSASDLLMKCIEFSCIELKHKLLKNA